MGKRELERELEDTLKSMVPPRRYKLRTPVKGYGRVTALARSTLDAASVPRGLELDDCFVRLDTKYMDQKGILNWNDDTLLRWAKEYETKPPFFYPFTILFLNRELYFSLKHEVSKICYAKLPRSPTKHS